MERKALIISNPGTIDPLAFELIGASTKRDDEQTIGFFGSGLKYAIAGLLRRGIDFQVWRGEELLEITTQEVTMRGKTFQRIYFNGVPSSLTTDMGPRWEKWMLIRELYANSIDEGGEMAVSAEFGEFIKEGRTTIVFPDVDQLKEVINDQDVLFCRGREIEYEDDRIRIYEEVGDGGYYVKGILVSRKQPGFGYMLKAKPYVLNEERQVADGFGANWQTVNAIFGITDKRMVKRLVARAKTDGSLEHNLLRHGYSFHDPKASEAWSDIILFKGKSEKFATEWNHLVVSDDIYESVKDIAKWEDRKWKKAGSAQQNDRLLQAVRIVEDAVPGQLPRSAWSFGTSESRNLGIGTEGDTVYVTDSLADESPSVLAAHIALSMFREEDNVKLLSRFFQQAAA